MSCAATKCIQFDGDLEAILDPAFLEDSDVGGGDAAEKLSMADLRSVIDAISPSNPHEIYLTGQSSVGLSFEQPAETLVRAAAPPAFAATQEGPVARFD